ncbi:hypothetical protein [Mycetocola tolaasinivorans]|uniref:hypothetical protein n=1 Tax=Mycetocola tolaasinivorans TaxID=76635 RepID=UPI00160454D7|nr:hypothetical protein [Mycetocola tolaasinivorans]
MTEERPDPKSAKIPHPPEDLIPDPPKGWAWHGAVATIGLCLGLVLGLFLWEVWHG